MLASVSTHTYVCVCVCVRPATGGQVGDSGRITFNGGSVTVQDTQVAAGYVLHVGEVSTLCVSVCLCVRLRFTYSRKPAHTSMCIGAARIGFQEYMMRGRYTCLCSHRPRVPDHSLLCTSCVHIRLRCMSAVCVCACVYGVCPGVGSFVSW